MPVKIEKKTMNTTELPVFLGLVYRQLVFKGIELYLKPFWVVRIVDRSFEMEPV